MKIEHVEVLVEERSMEVLLAQLLPRLLPGTSFQIHPHQGKPDLLAKLPGKLLAYARWIPPTWRILVVTDRDDEDCMRLKAQLDDVSRDLRASPGADRVVLNRLAIEELEAWYFGDWRAVRKAYPKAPAGIPAQAKYRSPDEIRGGTWEAFERVLQEAGYFVGGLRKIEAARAISSHMEPARNTSPSFRALRDALARWVE